MKKTLSIFSVILLTVIFCGIAPAQDTKSGFFMEGSTYRHRMNPAFFNESNYISFPIFLLGNVNLGITSNMGVSTFLFPQDNGQLTTFMNKSVSAADFLGGLRKENAIRANLSLDIASFGFLGKSGGFNTFDIGIRANVDSNMPYELFAFMKNGMSDASGTTYNIRNINVRSDAYLSVAYGYTNYVIDNVLSIGGKIKFLAGLANINADIRNMDISMSDKTWNVNADGEVSMYIPTQKFTYATDAEGRKYIDGTESCAFSMPSNYGAAIDLGVHYNMSDIVEGLAFSASVVDLGFIRWNGISSGIMDNSFEFSGFEEFDSNSVDTELNGLKDQLKEFARFYDNGTLSKENRMLSAKMYLAAEYKLPVYDKIKFGLLSSTVFNRPNSWTEGMLLCQFSPSDWFEMSVNYSLSKFGSAFGWMLNFHPKGFNFFVASDYFYTGRVSKQFIPIDKIRLNINFGFNITWGADRIAERKYNGR